MAVLTVTGSPTFNGDSSVTFDVNGKAAIPANSIIDRNQGWVAMRVKPSWAAGAPPTSCRVFDCGATNNILLSYDTVNLKWKMEYVIATVSNSISSAVQSFIANQAITVIGTWESGQLKVSVDGAAFLTVGKAGLSDNPTQFTVGNRTDGLRQIAGDIHWTAAGTGTLSDADAVTINAFGNTDPAWSAVPGTPNFLWYANDTSYYDANPSTDINLPTSARIRFSG